MTAWQVSTWISPVTRRISSKSRTFRGLLIYTNGLRVHQRKKIIRKVTCDWWPLVITITRDEAIREPVMEQLNAQRLDTEWRNARNWDWGNNQNVYGTETIQKNPTTRQTKFTKRLKTGALFLMTLYHKGQIGCPDFENNTSFLHVTYR